MLRYFITLFLIMCSFAQLSSANAEFTTAMNSANKEADDAFAVTFDQDGSKLVSEIWGTIYIKNRPLRDSVLALLKKRITKEEFQKIKENIEENNRYRYNLEVSLYPLSGDSVRIEIDPDRSRKRRYSSNRNRYRYDYDYDDDIDFDMDGDAGEAYGVGYDVDWMLEILEDSRSRDAFQIGLRGEAEHNFIRLFAGIEYASGIGPVKVRVGSGLVNHGVFQFNYSTGENGSEWQSSLGRLNSNLILTPQHIIGQLSPRIAVAKIDLLTENHALRMNYTIDNVYSSFADTLIVEEKKQKYGVRGEYTMSYLDNVRYPISGFYLNTQYQTVYIKDKTDDVPYQLGNKYANSIYDKGTFNNTVFGNVHGLIKYNYNSAIHLGVQGVYQRFNTSNFDLSAPVALGSVGFSEQEMQMIRATAGLRKRFDDDSMLEINFGMNQLRLYNNLTGTVEEKFLEVRMNSDAMEFKFMYIFDRETDNLAIEKYMHHQTGMVFSAALSLGSLY